MKTKKSYNTDPCGILEFIFFHSYNDHLMTLFVHDHQDNL